MAARRMLAKVIMESDKFLELSFSAQSLYVQLGLNADDDGFVNCAMKVCRMIGADPAELSLLIEKGYIIPFESGVIVIAQDISDAVRRTMLRPDMRMGVINRPAIHLRVELLDQCRIHPALLLCAMRCYAIAWCRLRQCCSQPPGLSNPAWAA